MPAALQLPGHALLNGRPLILRKVSRGRRALPQHHRESGGCQAAADLSAIVAIPEPARSSRSVTRMPCGRETLAAGAGAGIAAESP